MRYRTGKETDVFRKYEAGKAWNNKLEPSYYDLVTTNWEMFNGNQWLWSGANPDMPKPVVNVINRIISFFVASLTSNAVKVSFSEMTKGEEDSDADIKIVQDCFNDFAERAGLQDRVRELYLDAAVTGDMCVHMYLDPTKKPYNGRYSDVIGELDIELVDGSNVYFGNPNKKEVDKQPYILITGRDLISNLQAEYKLHNSDNVELKGDSVDSNQAGQAGDVEIEDIDGTGKATYVIEYKMKKGTVYVSKSVAEVEIYKDIDTELSMYPVIWGNWEKQKNNYHGRALCSSVIPNQIFINQMFAMVMLNLQLTAFPKLVYNKGLIDGMTNRVGGQIGVDLNKALPGTRLDDVAKYMQVGTMSPEIAQIIDMMMQYTKEMLGANDALLGSVNPEVASGVAISVAARQSGVPLENPRSHMYEMMDRLGKVFLDMVSVYYGERPVLVEQDGENVVLTYDFDKLRNMYMQTKVDVGATTYWNEIAQVQTMDNWLANGLIEFIDYLERVPEDYVVDKQGLIDKFKAAVPAQPSDGVLDQMTPEELAELETMTPEQQQSFMASFNQPAQ